MKDSSAARFLEQMYGKNAALLTQPCKLVDGQWMLLGRPASEFKPLNDAARHDLVVELYLLRKTVKELDRWRRNSSSSRESAG